MAKHAGLFLVILVLLSCEDKTGEVGFKNPNRDFEVFQKEFTIPTTVFLTDSLSTSVSSTSVDRLMCGYMDDPRFGKTAATAYTQYWPVGAPPSYNTSAVFQKLTLTLIFDYYWQGSTEPTQQTYQVFEVTDSILTYLPHFSNQSTPYGPLLGQAQKIVSPTAFEENIKTNADGDTSNDIMDSLNVDLDPELGRRLLTLALDTAGTNELNYLIFSRFRRAFKGLAVVGSVGNGNDKIIGFNPNDKKSRMTLTYKVDTTEYRLTYQFNPPGSSDGLTQYMSYTQFQNDRSGTPLAAMSSTYTDVEPTDGLRYIQSGTGVTVKLDLTEVRDHFKNIPVKAFSVAELRIETDQQTMAHKSFLLRALRRSRPSKATWISSEIQLLSWMVLLYRSMRSHRAPWRAWNPLVTTVMGSHSR